MLALHTSAMNETLPQNSVLSETSGGGVG